MKIQNLKVLGSKVLLRAYEWPEKIGSIWLPDMVRYSETKGGKDPWRGMVITVGPDVKQVKAGEIVRYQPDNYSRQTVHCDDDLSRYISLDESMIYSVEDDKENPVRALKNRIVFLPDNILEKAFGRIYLPQKHEMRFLCGNVVASGCDYIKVGERVLIENKSTWQYFDGGGKRYIMTDRVNVLARLGKDEVVQ